MLDLLVKGFQLWEPGNKSRNMDKEKMEDSIVDGVCSNENKVNEGKKKPRKPDYKEPPFWDEFGPLWGPGSKYKPWI